MLYTLFTNHVMILFGTIDLINKTLVLLSLLFCVVELKLNCSVKIHYGLLKISCALPKQFLRSRKKMEIELCLGFRIATLPHMGERQL